MSTAATETMVFDADISGVSAKLAQVQALYASVTGELKDLGSVSKITGDAEREVWAQKTVQAELYRAELGRLKGEARALASEAKAAPAFVGPQRPDAMPGHVPYADGMRKMDEAQRQLNETTKHGVAVNRNWQMGLVELARGTEDFASQIQNGIGPALRASNNNIAQLAMSLGGPLVGAIVSFGAIAASMLIPKLFDSGVEAKSAKEEMEDYKEMIKATSHELAELEYGKEFARQKGVNEKLAGLREKRDTAAAEFQQSILGTSSEFAKGVTTPEQARAHIARIAANPQRTGGDVAEAAALKEMLDPLNEAQKKLDEAQAREDQISKFREEAAAKKSRQEMKKAWEREGEAEQRALEQEAKAFNPAASLEKERDALQAKKSVAEARLIRQQLAAEGEGSAGGAFVTAEEKAAMKPLETEIKTLTAVMKDLSAQITIKKAEKSKPMAAVDRSAAGAGTL